MEDSDYNDDDDEISIKIKGKRGRKANSFLNNLKRPKRKTKDFKELGREELQKMTEKQFEKYLGNLISQRQLEKKEIEEFKKIRRLIKNRIYARVSREKTKTKINDYEEDIETKDELIIYTVNKLENLEDENRLLKEKISLLTIENEFLKNVPTDLMNLVN